MPSEPKRVLYRAISPLTWMLQLSLFLVDLLVVHLSVILAFKLFLGDMSGGKLYFQAYKNAALPGIIIYATVFSLLNLFNFEKPNSGIDFIFTLVKALTLSLLLFICSVFFSRGYAESTYHLPRIVVVFSFLFSLFFLNLWRKFFHYFFQRRWITRKVIGLGSKSDIDRYITMMNKRHHYNYICIHYVDESEDVSDLVTVFALDDFDEVIDFSRKVHIDELWNLLFRNCRKPHMTLKIMPTTAELLTGNLNLTHLSDIPLHEVPMYPIRGWNSILKRLFDVIASSVGLLVFSLPMALVALGVRLSSPGSIFYKQKRVGRFGREFEVIKFRSMPENIEKETGPVIAGFNDDRCTPFGRFIRRWALDELPQLFCVLRGDMSLVGPRPERLHFIDKNPVLGGRRLSIKPGLTGLAQVNSRFYLKLTDKIRYDLFYMDNYSLLLDIKVCFMTFHVLWTETGKVAIKE